MVRSTVQQYYRFRLYEIQTNPITGQKYWASINKYYNIQFPIEIPQEKYSNFSFLPWTMGFDGLQKKCRKDYDLCETFDEANWACYDGGYFSE